MLVTVKTNGENLVKNRKVSIYPQTESYTPLDPAQVPFKAFLLCIHSCVCRMTTMQRPSNQARSIRNTPNTTN